MSSGSSLSPPSSSSLLRTGLRRLSYETGFSALVKSSKDVHVLILLKIFRMFAFGQTGIFLVHFFKAQGYSESRTGLFMSSTLAGDVVISYLLTINADHLGRRLIMFIGAAMMVASGIIFATTNNFFLLLIAAIIGIISPSGTDVGPFKAIEESSLAHLLNPEIRNDVFTWYSLGSALSLASGNMFGGWLIRFVIEKYGFSDLEAYKSIFFTFGIFGAIKCLLVLLLSSKTESDEYNERKKLAKNITENEWGSEEDDDNTPSETTSLLKSSSNRPDTKADAIVDPSSTPSSSSVIESTSDDNNNNNNGNGNVESSANSSQAPSIAAGTGTPTKSKVRLTLKLSQGSKLIVIQLSIISAINFFGASLAPPAWISYYIGHKFSVDPQTLGSIFFSAGIISCFAMLISPSIAKRLGIVFTLIATHIPASLLIILLPVPTTLTPTIVIYVLRTTAKWMDNGPRRAFMSSIIPAKERTMVMGWMNVVKTISQVSGPSVVGYLASRNLQWICFLLAGSLKLVYDFFLFYLFAKKDINRENE